MPDYQFEGQGILDLDAERAQLEYAIEHLDGAEESADAVARMRARLAVIRGEVVRQGHW